MQPKITYLVNQTASELEEQITLTCEASGDPTPTITWSFGRRIFTEGEQVLVSRDQVRLATRGPSCGGQGMSLRVPTPDRSITVLNIDRKPKKQAQLYFIHGIIPNLFKIQLSKFNSKSHWTCTNLSWWFHALVSPSTGASKQELPGMIFKWSGNETQYMLGCCDYILYSISTQIWLGEKIRYNRTDTNPVICLNSCNFFTPLTSDLIRVR